MKKFFLFLILINLVYGSEYPNDVLGVKLSEKAKIWNSMEQRYGFSDADTVDTYLLKPITYNKMFESLIFDVSKKSNKVFRIKAFSIKFNSIEECSSANKMIENTLMQKYKKLKRVKSLPYVRFEFKTKNKHIQVYTGCSGHKNTFNEEYNFTYGLIDKNLEKEVKIFEKELKQKKLEEKNKENKEKLKGFLNKI
ncbi:hypothetical protein [Poseidonibacter ostreae]|jgi:hypothetical protein|uniref:Uncharacterized protein n=1 Tax=Poseidonibacter ostreae TaxID=2654171 RepID=A0A6L4WS10_9BACT|nr:hypothetical protein [Poseidonibacter ostreae]KAB7887140.1 hypothetical protein GA417_03690 [Poseidonibacter ostreae]KAB7888646.1 hypothetical protein GBG19_08530 [Poseidonibacter ostreae]KAB7892307.1 hypothetical protein GBG18_03390 [Poseidonibacter ostreae]